MPAPPWSLATGIAPVTERWMKHAELRGCFHADRSYPAEEAASAPLPDDIDRRLAGALASRGITRLYRHQRVAIDSARAGRHVVIATPTASGKSLCFHLPVLDAIARDPASTAIYLYPTKALSRDQEQGVRSLIGEAGLAVGATVYDGDTPGDARRTARQRAQIIMTNPDMLHAGILPQHASWARVLSALRYVIVDELHSYRGVFGAHVAQVLARLARVARFHGAEPVFICATATIGNARDHAAQVIGVDRDAVEVVDRSGAPRGSRRVLVYNPPVVNAELGIRASYVKSAVRLTADLLEARVRTILFGRSRNAVEIMLKYLRDRFAEQPALRDAIVAYRGGYLPDQRRKVERGLREGEVLCVVATSALELGIDIGDLDACVCAGYPGSLAETWQRFGRAGRRAADSLALLVASSTPLDQYLATHPALLLDGGFEEARVDPGNTEIVIQHLKCAAFELPFTARESFARLARDDTEAALDFLEQHGVVHRSRDRYHWATDSFPANHVSLRSVGWDNFVIVDVESDRALAELDWHSTPSMLHEQAIYQHDGAQFQVERLDYDNHKAYVRRVEPDYFTTAMRHVKVRVLIEAARAPLAASAAPCTTSIGWGDCCVTEKVVGYKKIKFHTHENAGYGDVRLPDIDMHTTSFWLTLPAAVCAAVEPWGGGRVMAIEGLSGLGHALELVATLALMCDPHDLGRALDDGADVEQADATLFLYDNIPGGVGLSERIFERAHELIARAAELVARCACPLGCPSCVGATALASQDGPAPHTVPLGADRKHATLALAAALGLRPAPSPRRPETDRRRGLYLVT
jgi:DEAD/DEAH box helicase domain-containing protein